MNIINLNKYKITFTLYLSYYLYYKQYINN